MVKVLMIPGKNFDPRQFIEIVRKCCGLLYVSADSGSICGDAATQLLILELRNVAGPCDFGADIVLIGNEVADIHDLPYGCIKKNALVVFDPEDAAHCRFIERRGLRPVTCGVGERNTLSVSSIADDAIVLTVGRDVQNVKGEFIEIQDHIYHAQIWDVPSAILACALLLLTQEKENI